MRASLITFPAALALAACVEVDMAIEVLGEDEARVTGFMQMQRQMFEMSGGDESFCPEEDGGTLTLTDTHARCDFDKTGSYAEIVPSESSSDGPAEVEGELTYLGDNRTRVFLPLAAMNAGMDEMGDDPQMLEMMRQMLSGMSVSFTVKGREIESSTGTISEDGSAATIMLGIDDLIPPAADRIGDFETILRF